MNRQPIRAGSVIHATGMPEASSRHAWRRRAPGAAPILVLGLGLLAPGCGASSSQPSVRDGVAPPRTAASTADPVSPAKTGGSTAATSEPGDEGTLARQELESASLAPPSPFVPGEARPISRSAPTDPDSDGGPRDEFPPHVDAVRPAAARGTLMLPLVLAVDTGGAVAAPETAADDDVLNWDEVESTPRVAPGSLKPLTAGGLRARGTTSSRPAAAPVDTSPGLLFDQPASAQSSGAAVDVDQAPDPSRARVVDAPEFPEDPPLPVESAAQSTPPALLSDAPTATEESQEDSSPSAPQVADSLPAESSPQKSSVGESAPDDSSTVNSFPPESPLGEPHPPALLDEEPLLTGSLPPSPSDAGVETLPGGAAPPQVLPELSPTPQPEAPEHDVEAGSLQDASSVPVLPAITPGLSDSAAPRGSSPMLNSPGAPFLPRSLGPSRPMTIHAPRAAQSPMPSSEAPSPSSSTADSREADGPGRSTVLSPGDAASDGVGNSEPAIPAIPRPLAGDAPPSDNRDSSRSIAAEEAEHGDDSVDVTPDAALTAWEVRGGQTARWRISDGIVQCSGPEGGWLQTKTPYSDFTLSFEFQLSRGANTGVAVRCGEDGDPSRKGFEIQLIDDRDPGREGLRDDQRCGGVYFLSAAQRRAPLHPSGSWNSCEIACIGSRLTVTINGVLVNAATLANDAPNGTSSPGGRAALGRIALQGSTAPAAFRRLRLQDAAATTPSGVRIVDIQQGSGELVSSESEILVHFHARLADGRTFSNSREHGPAVRLPLKRAIPGLREGLIGMRVGGVRKVVTPPELGYGERGVAELIPPDATLVFEVEVQGVVR